MLPTMMPRRLPQMPEAKVPRRAIARGAEPAACNRHENPLAAQTVPGPLHDTCLHVSKTPDDTGTSRARARLNGPERILACRPGLLSPVNAAPPAQAVLDLA
jgi:hypothetical protein